LDGLQSAVFGKSFVGLSIGSSSIKIAELVRKGSGFRLVNLGVMQLPEEAIQNREIANPIAVSEAIRALVQQMKLKTRQCVLGLSGSSILSKVLRIEAPNKKDLRDQVYWEAEQYIPFDMNEMVIDFDTLSRTSQGLTEVLMVASKRSFMDSYLQCVQEAGLKVHIIDIDLLALHHIFELTYPATDKSTFAIVDVGGNSTKVAIFAGGVPKFTKEMGLGGIQLTGEIQRQLNVQYHDAELMKVQSMEQQAVPQAVFDMSHSYVENITNEVARALDFYSVSNSGALIEAVYLAGGSSRLAGLCAKIEQTTQIKTELMAPFAAIQYDKAVFQPSFVEMMGPSAAVPIGLAIRGAYP
jgi:type IV pilus assembly protein PilM